MKLVAILALALAPLASCQFIEEHPETIDRFAAFIDEGSEIGAHYATSDEFPPDLVAEALGAALDAVSAFLIEEGGSPLPVSGDELAAALVPLLETLAIGGQDNDPG